MFGEYVLTVSLAADVNRDYEVNLADVALLGESWLRGTSSVTDVSPADEGDYVTDLNDWSVLCEMWLVDLTP